MNHYKTDKNEICQEWRDNLAAFAKEHEFPGNHRGRRKMDFFLSPMVK